MDDMSDLRKDLECPVCLNLMIPPITLCNNGHNICNVCKPELKKCPQCEGELLETRNKTAEHLTEKIKYPCRYQSSGCGEEILLGMKPGHEEECVYGPHKCPFYIVDKMCSWEGPLADIQAHITNTHTRVGNVTHVTAGKQNTELPNFTENSEEGGGWYQAVFTLGEVFFRYTKVMNDLLYTCCMHVGAEAQARNFSYRITLTSTDGTEEEVARHVCPSYKQFMQEGFRNTGAEFSLNFAKKCVDEDDELCSKFEIIKS